GRKLLLRVKDIMHEGDQIPVVTADKTLQDALIEMTQKGLGMTTIMSDDAKLVGIFTDGDLRRIIDLKVDFATTSVSDVMSADPKTVPQNMLAAEALTIMEKASITALIVEEEDHITGVLHLHDVLRAGVI
ncbi:MAG: CBS domain-containing protein, partial [Porticoccaceae bacterium]|nr:CBS domain-containing protein [Porticoccaceae bacterium]